jgi:pyruvyltransferase
VNYISLRVKYIILKLIELGAGIVCLISKKVALNYCIEKNAGDSFNKYFLKDFYARNISKYTFGSKKHFLFCGSIIARSNRFSVILGAGFISKEASEKVVDFAKVIGVRGYLSLDALRKMRGETVSPEFIGDPGLLARELIEPNHSENNSGLIGVIPHFVDYSLAKDVIKNNENFRLIDIRRHYVEVCNDIKGCDVILSSSLHGLIFSDAMNVKNSWITFGFRVKGGKFKFLDYYSASTNPRSDWIFCNTINNLKDAATKAMVSNNVNYVSMRKSVSFAFSGDFENR